MASEPQAVEKIIAQCARLPLALAIVAARAVTHPHFSLTELANELCNTQDRWNALVEGEPATDVRAVFSWSYNTLTPEVARLFRLLGLHPGPDISVPAAASLARLPPVRVRPLLGELARSNLIIEHAYGRYTFHDLLRAYAAGQTHCMDSEDQCRAATLRMLDHYLHTAHAADQFICPTREPIALGPPQPGAIPEQLADRKEAVAWFTIEHQVMIAAVEHAVDAGLDSHAWQIGFTLWPFQEMRGHIYDKVATTQAALTAARRLADPYAQARSLHSLARALATLRRFDEARACFCEALHLFAQSGDLANEANTHLMLAEMLERWGRFEEGLKHARQALEIRRAADHLSGQAYSLCMFGLLHSRLGDHQYALAYCQEALKIWQRSGDNPSGLCFGWEACGVVHHNLGDYESAISCFQYALNLSRNLGECYYETGIVARLGDSYCAAGKPDGARQAWQQALAVFATLDYVDNHDADQVRRKLQYLDHVAKPSD